MIMLNSICSQPFHGKNSPIRIPNALEAPLISGVEVEASSPAEVGSIYRRSCQRETGATCKVEWFFEKKTKEECNSSKGDLINESRKTRHLGFPHQIDFNHPQNPKLTNRKTPSMLGFCHLNELQLFWHIGRSWRMLKIKTISISPSLQVLRRQSLLAIVEVVIPEKICGKMGWRG